MSQEDIVVYKELELSGGNWLTPLRRYKVFLDSEITPDQSTPDIKQNSGHYLIEGGVIHSYTRTTKTGNYFFRSIIPGGTRFWISDDLLEVASERLQITSDWAYEGDETDFSGLSSYFLDLFMKDRKRIKWSPKINLEDVKGIYVYDSQIIDINIYRTVFSRKPIRDLPDDLKLVREDCDGRGRTEYLRERYPDIEILQALPDDSYIPALGELSRGLENLLQINLTRHSLGLEIINQRWLESCTLCGNKCSNNWGLWCVVPGRLDNWEASKFSVVGRGGVLPFIR